MLVVRTDSYQEARVIMSKAPTHGFIPVLQIEKKNLTRHPHSKCRYKHTRSCIPWHVIASRAPLSRVVSSRVLCISSNGQNHKCRTFICIPRVMYKFLLHINHPFLTLKHTSSYSILINVGKELLVFDAYVTILFGSRIDSSPGSTILSSPQ